MSAPLAISLDFQGALTEKVRRVEVINTYHWNASRSELLRKKCIFFLGERALSFIFEGGEEVIPHLNLEIDKDSLLTSFDSDIPLFCVTRGKVAYFYSSMFRHSQEQGKIIFTLECEGKITDIILTRKVIAVTYVSGTPEKGTCLFHIKFNERWDPNILEKEYLPPSKLSLVKGKIHITTKKLHKRVTTKRNSSEGRETSSEGRGPTSETFSEGETFSESERRNSDMILEPTEDSTFEGGITSGDFVAYPTKEDEITLFSISKNYEILLTLDVKSDIIAFKDGCLFSYSDENDKKNLVVFNLNTTAQEVEKVVNSNIRPSFERNSYFKRNSTTTNYPLPQYCLVPDKTLKLDGGDSTKYWALNKFDDY